MCAFGVESSDCLDARRGGLWLATFIGYADEPVTFCARLSRLCGSSAYHTFESEHAVKAALDEEGEQTRAGCVNAGERFVFASACFE